MFILELIALLHNVIFKYIVTRVSLYENAVETILTQKLLVNFTIIKKCLVTLQ